MPPKRSRLSGVILNGQSREIVANVLKFLKTESMDCRGYLRTINNAGGETKVYIGEVQKRCSAATTVSLRTIQNISKEQRQIEDGKGTSFVTPNRKKKKSKPKRDMDEFDKGVVRRTVHQFIVQEKSVPTVNNLLHKLSKEIGFDGGRETLRLILRDVGFKWQKTRTNRKVLVEKHNVKMKRIDYLIAMKKYRDEGRPIVYMGETCISSCYTSPKTGSDDSNNRHTIPSTKRERLRIVHAGGEGGFVPNAMLMWKENQTTAPTLDHQTNRMTYDRWLGEKLIPNLQPNSVLVIDGSSYHNYQAEKVPTSTAEKSDMIKWLRKNEIPHTASMLKPQLYQLVLMHKPKLRCTVDKILSSAGHTALHIPPYHRDLNPVEMIWGQLKNWVANKNVISNKKDLKVLCETMLAGLGASDWLLFCERVKNIEKEYHQREHIIDKEMENIIVNLGEADSNSSDSDKESDDGDDDDADSDD